MYAKRKKSPHTKALDKADAAFSIWFRANAADENGLVKCVTCGRIMKWKMPDGSCHTGHYQSRGFSSVRFMPENCGVQCVKCNTYLEGRKVDFRAHLVKLHGEETVSKIDLLSKLPNKRLSDFELNEIAKHFKREADRLAKIKGL